MTKKNVHNIFTGHEGESVESLVYLIKMIKLSQLQKLIEFGSVKYDWKCFIRIEKLWSATTPEYKEPKFCTVFV